MSAVAAISGAGGLAAVTGRQRHHHAKRIVERINNNDQSAFVRSTSGATTSTSSPGSTPRIHRRGSLARIHASRTPKNPEDWGKDYDKIREELMSREGGGFISNTVNWFSQNTFGALPAEGTRMRQSIDVIASTYRSFLDALPYRRQDGRAARALPKGRAANAFAEWEAFKSGKGKNKNDNSPAVGGRESLLQGEAEVIRFWEGVSEEAADAVKSKSKSKAPNSVVRTTSSGDTRLVMSTGQCRALAADTMALVLALRRAAAAGEGTSSSSSSSSAAAAGERERALDVALVDASAVKGEDTRAELLSGWGGGGSDVALSGGYGAITPAEAAEAAEASSWGPTEVARRVRVIAALLLCTPGEAIAVCHRFPAVLETPQSVIASRLAALKDLLPRADAAVIVRAEPRLLLDGDDEIFRGVADAVAAMKRELPGINADKLVEIEPRMLFEDISESLEALRELWPEEAFRQSDRDNPFFAEELALAIKALNGKGKEKPFKRL